MSPGALHSKISLRGCFGFGGHQENARSGLGYKLTIDVNSKNTVLSEATPAPVIKKDVFK